MNLEAHVHCYACFREIAAKIKLAGGRIRDAEIVQATAFDVIPAPQGIQVVPRQVPICPECHQRAQKAAQQAGSRIVVPKIDTGALKVLQ